MDWLAAYEIDTDERASDLREPATLTVILRDLDTDERSYAFLPIEPVPAGDAQREAILRVMAGRYPDAVWKTYNADKQAASFVGRRHLYLVIYEEHDVERRSHAPQPALFTV